MKNNIISAYLPSSGEMIEIDSIDVIDATYNQKIIKRMVINQNFELKTTQKPLIKFLCAKCGKTVEEKYRTYEKFFVTEVICSSCSKKETYTKNWGADHPMKCKSQIEIRKKTKLDRYGDENYNNRKKAQETYLEKYDMKVPNCFGSNEFKESMIRIHGAKNPMQCESLRKKSRQTMFDKNGVEYSFQVPETVKKSKKTKFYRYGDDGYNNRNKARITSLKLNGVDHHMKTDNSKKLIQKINREKKYEDFINGNRLDNRVVPMFSLEEYFGGRENGIVERKYKWKCIKCNNVFSSSIYCGRVPRCYQCYPIKSIHKSRYEIEILEFLKKSGINNILTSNRSILWPRELDLYFPDFCFAIEFDGIYWHSDARIKNQNYHLLKTEKCLKKNIRLIHIFEDEWVEKQEIVKSLILKNLNIFNKTIKSNELEIKKILNVDYFLENNHIFGKAQSDLNIGIFLKNELISVMCIKENEIIRFCDKINLNIPDSFQKLVYETKKIKNMDFLLYKVDRRYYNENLNKIKNENPKFYYVDGIKRFESSLPLNLHKIWDCGTTLYRV